ncbi:MAG: hypothetical protein AAF745_10080 [Planctomycetota bacterium]
MDSQLSVPRDVGRYPHKRMMPDDDTFLADFEACRWPLSKWHHREHIKLAYLYLRRSSFEEALSRIRNCIKAHNKFHDLPDSQTSGYHETITQAWFRLVQFVIDEDGPATDADEFYEAHPELAQKMTLRLLYSRKLIMSHKAKMEFCEPDLIPFPKRREHNTSG